MSHGDCAVFVVVIERWKRKVGGGWIVAFFFFCWGWWLPVEKWQKRKVVGAWIVFFFLLPIAVVYGCGWWGNGGSGCCDGLVFFFFPSFVEVFGFGICWCCWCC